MLKNFQHLRIISSLERVLDFQCTYDVFIGVLNEDFLVKLPRKSVSEYVIFNGGHAPRPPSNSLLCMLVVLCTTWKASTSLT